MAIACSREQPALVRLILEVDDRLTDSKKSVVQLLSKQPGYHRPQAAAPAALPWAQQGQMQAQHAGWAGQPAPQYQQQFQPNQGQAWQPPAQVNDKSSCP